MITAKNVLIEAINLLETKGWTQDEFARDINGVGVGSLSKSATCYCTIGAINAATSALVERNTGWDEERRADLRLNAKRAVRQVIQGGIAMWNDTEGRTKDEVIEALKQAADIVEG